MARLHPLNQGAGGDIKTVWTCKPRQHKHQHTLAHGRWLHAPALPGCISRAAASSSLPTGI